MMADEDETERLFFLTSRFWTGLELRLSIIRKTHTHTHTHQHDGRWNIHQLKWIIEEGCGLRRWRRQEEMKGWREGSGVSRSLKSLEKSEIDGEGTKLSPSLRYFYFQRFKKKVFSVSSACLRGSGWTSWGTLTSSSTSTWRRWWTRRCTSSLRPSWTPAPNRSTNSAESVHANKDRTICF